MIDHEKDDGRPGTLHRADSWQRMGKGLPVGGPGRHSPHLYEPLCCRYQGGRKLLCSGLLWGKGQGDFRRDAPEITHEA